MKTYKWLRGVLAASAMTSLMFVMQACYGSPNMPPEMPDDMELTDENTVSEHSASTDLQSDGVEYVDLQSE